MYFGATADQVAQRLQGSNLDITIYAIGATTGTVRIQTLMAQAVESIKAKIQDKKTLDALNFGRFDGHKVIFQTQNTAQTAVDPGQEFPGTVDVDTFKIAQNQELTVYDEGLAATEYDITTNALTVSATKSRGDSFVSYYTVDPDSIDSPQLAALVIDWAALILAREEIFGGDGDDQGLSDLVETTILPNLNEQMQALQEDTSIAKLLKLRMCVPFTSPNTATISRMTRDDSACYEYNPNSSSRTGL